MSKCESSECTDEALGECNVYFGLRLRVTQHTKGIVRHDVV